MAKRPATPKLGSVYSIKLRNGEYAFGQVCAGGDYAFFDLKLVEPSPPIETVINSPVAFRVPVAADAAVIGGWQLIGVALPLGTLAFRGQYRHRPVGSQQVFLYTEGRSSPATEDEVKDLEVLATWFSNHVESRLEDHFAGRPNEFAQSLEMR